MNYKLLKAIIFDLDDTLYLERDFVLSGFHAVSRWLDRQYQIDSQAVFVELCKMFNKGYRGDLFNRLICTYSGLDISVEEMIKVYRNHDPVIKPFEGIKELLVVLKIHNKLGLISDGYLSVQRNKLTSLKLDKYFDVVIFSDKYGKQSWKPSVTLFVKALEELNVQPAETVYIADNPEKDFKGPNKLGMKSIRLLLKGGEHYNKSPKSSEYAPTVTFTSIHELSKKLYIMI